MKVGDLIKINDLCRDVDLRGAVGTIIETNVRESCHSWSLVRVLIGGSVLQFRQDSDQMEMISD